MKSITIVQIIFGLLFVASCRYLPVQIAEDCADTVHEDAMERVKLFLGNVPSSRLKAKAGIDGEWITCYIVNVSEEDVVLLRGHEGYQYFIMYYDGFNCRHEYYSSFVQGHILENLEVLESLGSTDVGIHSWNSTLYEIKVPKDCRKIVGLWLGVGMVTFTEMSECKGRSDLSRLFDRNQRYVFVEWWK